VNTCSWHPAARGDSPAISTVREKSSTASAQSPPSAEGAPGEKIEKLPARLAPDLENVFKAGRRHQRGE
jgi:hypothetical protein